jgi:hypothetical protein
MREHLRGILDELCNSTDILYALAVIEAVLLVISIGGMIYLGPGSAGFVIWLLNAIGLVVLLSFTVFVLTMCFRR